MKTLFERCTINGMEMRNRLVRSATWEGLCDEEGRPTAKLADCYRQLAETGLGLIVSGYTFVLPEGRSMPFQMGMYRDDFAADCMNLTETVHRAGGKIAVQLAHAGGQTNAGLTGRQPLAPSAVPVPYFPELPAALGKGDIDTIIRAFHDAARRGRDWGFDAVQLHAGHGYLISQFASPLTNRRTDDYGGSRENRARFILELYQAVRDAVGPGYPVMVKMNITDYLPGGLETGDGLFIAEKLAEAGIDAIEVTAGTMASEEQMPLRTNVATGTEEGYHRDLARLVKKTVQCPVIVVGGFRSYEGAQRAIETDGLDHVALSRPLVREPDLLRRWQEGQRQTATCISCNGCVYQGLNGGEMYCVVDGRK